MYNIREDTTEPYVCFESYRAWHSFFIDVRSWMMAHNSLSGEKARHTFFFLLLFFKRTLHQLTCTNGYAYSTSSAHSKNVELERSREQPQKRPINAKPWTTRTSVLNNKGFESCAQNREVWIRRRLIAPHVWSSIVCSETCQQTKKKTDLQEK